MFPVPSFEWIITHKCNYQCTYCFQENLQKKHCSDDTIEAVFKYLPKLNGNWLIKLIGGEPFVHPKFFEICEKIINNGHNLCATTNFSLSIDKLDYLISLCNDKLNYITASLHLDQVSSIDNFINKAAYFNNNKNSKTDFIITSVVTPSNFQLLKNIEKRFATEGLLFKFQSMKYKNKYVKYSDEIEQYISDKLISNTDFIKNINLFGTFCQTGKHFFKIDVDGNATRCYNHQPFFHMGSFPKGTFRRFPDTKPCLSRRCTCTVPANRNMICYGQKATNYVIFKEFLNGCFNNLNLNKNQYTKHLINKFMAKKSP